MKNFVNFRKSILLALALLSLAGCGEQKRQLGEVIAKKIDYDKFRLIVLAKSEYDEKGNIIHKRTGTYKDMAADSGMNFSEEKTLFNPVLRDRYNIYYEHDYDENGNLTHTFIHNSKNEDALEYFFDYDESGKIVHCKNGNGEEYWYQYDEHGNMTQRKSLLLKNLQKDEDEKYIQDDYTHEYKNGSVKTKLEEFKIWGHVLGGLYCERSYDEQKQRNYDIWVKVKDETDKSSGARAHVCYKYGEKTNTEYYSGYRNGYGYGTFFGSGYDVVGIDGKIYFDSHDGTNHAGRTFIVYYLRDDGSVEKSIEYTGFRETQLYQRRKRNDRRTGREVYVPVLGNYEYD